MVSILQKIVDLAKPTPPSIVPEVWEKQKKATAKKMTTVFQSTGKEVSAVSSRHYVGFNIENPLAQQAQKEKNSADDSNKKMNHLQATGDILVAAKGVTPFTPNRMFSQEVDLSYSIINFGIAIFGYLSQLFSKKTAEKTTFGDVKGDLSADKIAEYGKIRFGSKFLSASFGLTAGIGAFTGLNAISGRAVLLVGSFCSSLAMGCFFLIAKERTDWTKKVAEEFKVLGVDGLRNKLQTIEEEDIRHLQAFAKSPSSLEGEEKAQRFNKILERAVVPAEVRERFKENVELLEVMETFMLARREHYGRFIGQKNVQRLLENPRYEFNSRNASYFESKDLLKRKIEKTLQVQSTLWKVVQVFSLLTISVYAATNFITAGLPDLVIAILNLAIAIGWSIVDTYFFISDMLEGGYTKDQFYAFLVTQASFLLLAAGAFLIHPLASLAGQAALMGVGLSGIIYNLITDLRKKPTEATRPQELSESISAEG
jgi:hypothetical protein